MKKTSAVIFIFVVLVWSAYSRSQKSNASVEVIDGIEFVHNTEIPMYPDKTVSFIEDLSISGEEKELTKKDGIYAMIGSYDREKAIVFPDQRPYFGRFISDDTGRLYVIRSKSILERDEQTSSVDVFSKEGIYLYNMSWDFIPALIKNSFLYEVRVDEDAGDIKVLRHKITNWNRFKEE